MRRVLPAVLLLVVLTGGCASLQPAAAIVNGQKISESSLQEEVDRVRDDPNFQELLKTQGDRIRGVARRQVLTRFIRETLIDQAAHNRGVKVTDSQISAFVANLSAQVGGGARFRDLLEQAKLTRDRVRVLARRQIVQQELEKRVTADLEVTDDQIKAWYEQNKAQLTEYHLQKIVVPSQDVAAKIVQQATGGADFGRLARDQSKDSTASKGGDVGFVDPAALGNALASQVQASSPGAVIGPVRGASGFEVYKLVEQRTKPIEQVRDQIVAQLSTSGRQDAFESWVTAALRKAKIVVNPKYGVFDRSSGAVTAARQPLPE